MNDHINHTAHYQVSSFISSDSFMDFNLTPYEIVILWTIARYLDMPKKICCAKQTTLIKECGMSERQFRNSCQKLVDLGLLIRTLKGNLYNYYLGFHVTKQEEF